MNLTWLRPLEDGNGPRYRQIAQQIADAVESGVLQAQDRLPTQRALAELMGVDLTTVSRAYSVSRLRGLVDAHGSGGTYVAEAATTQASSVVVDLSMNIPPQLTRSASARFLRGASAHAATLASTDSLMSYKVGPGAKPDRDAGAAWLRPVLGRLDSQQIVVCPGAQAAIAALLLTQTRAGDAVLSEILTYPGFLAAARLLGRNVVPVAADDEGMRPDALDAACTKHRPTLLFLTPTISNPTATTMSGPRRSEIYEVARRNGVGIVEDDPYWLLAGDAPPPIATLTSKASSVPVFYISTLSKCLSPGLRTAYLVVPPSIPMAPILDAIRCMVLMPSAWMTAMATHWIRTGVAQEVLNTMRQELAARQVLARLILPAESAGHAFGLHRWLPLPQSCDQYRLVQLAREQGLEMAPSYAFAVTDTPVNAVRISLGGAPDKVALGAALKKLGALLGSAQ